MFVLLNIVVISRLSHIYRMGEEEECKGKSSEEAYKSTSCDTCLAIFGMKQNCKIQIGFSNIDRP
jgi:hypothetical protein